MQTWQVQATALKLRYCLFKLLGICLENIRVTAHSKKRNKEN